MSSPFEASLLNSVNNYLSNPSKQINIGYTVVSFWSTGGFFLGLFLIIISLLIMILNNDYLHNNVSKNGLVVLAWVGLALVLTSLWSTIGSFYRCVGRINDNVKLKRNCSLFRPENPENALEVLASETLKEENVRNYINVKAESLRNGESGIYPANDKYGGIADASTNSILFSKPKEVSSPRQGPDASRLALTRAEQNPFLRDRAASPDNRDDTLRRLLGENIGLSGNN